MTRFCSLFLFAFAPVCGLAQKVEAHYGQYLVTSAMSDNPGLQKMGIHVVPPGATDEAIVACSVPSKIGKKSSAADLEEERSGTPFVKAAPEREFYDLALPLSDAANHPIGAVVMEMRFAAASSAEDAVHRAEAIRDELQRKIASRDALFGEAPAGAPLDLLGTTALPGITGDFDHFAIDRQHNRLYVAAEVHSSIEVFDLKTGEHLKSVSGVTTPHTIAYVPETQQLLVADGGDSSCRVFDGSNLQQVKRIPLAAGPDAGLYDEKNRVFYIGNGGRGAKEAFSWISIIAADSLTETGRIRVEASNLESMALDEAANLLYVNMRDKNRIAVVDLQKKSVRALWSIPNLNLNTPMAFDAVHRRLFVAGRKPGKLFVIDTQTGKALASLDCVETADDMTFDAEHARIYVTGSGGVTVIAQEGPDRYRTIAQFDTNGGKTSIYDAELRRFYIAHSKTQFDNAALQVYAVR